MAVMTPQRLLAFVRCLDKEGGEFGCWSWTGASSDQGYGVASTGRGAHRLAYELMVGPIPAGLELDHLCRNSACVNPHHLEPVTHVENIRRSREFGPREFRRYCLHGHALTRDNVRMWSNGTERRALCYACHRNREQRRGLRRAG